MHDSAHLAMHQHVKSIYTLEGVEERVALGSLNACETSLGQSIHSTFRCALFKGEHVANSQVAGCNSTASQLKGDPVRSCFGLSPKTIAMPAFRVNHIRILVFCFRTAICNMGVSFLVQQTS